MAGIDEGVVQVRADDEDEFTEGEMMYQPLKLTPAHWPDVPRVLYTFYSS